MSCILYWSVYFILGTDAINKHTSEKLISSCEKLISSYEKRRDKYKIKSHNIHKNQISPRNNKSIKLIPLIIEKYKISHGRRINGKRKWN